MAYREKWADTSRNETELGLPTLDNGATLLTSCGETSDKSVAIKFQSVQERRAKEKHEDECEGSKTDLSLPFETRISPGARPESPKESK